MFDEKLFKNLLKLAIGKRTMTEFAKNSGISRPYISKYINGRLDVPPSPIILRRMAQASQGRITYMSLMISVGYITKEDLYIE